MNPLQTTLLALPAAVTSFLGAFSFLSDAKSELKIAAIMCSTDFPEFVDRDSIILKRWTAVMAARDHQKKANDAGNRERRDLEQRLKVARPNFEQLGRDLRRLRDDSNSQKKVTFLENNDWTKNVSELDSEIKSFLDPINLEMQNLNNDSDKSDLKQNKSKAESLLAQIKEKQQILKTKQPDWRGKLEIYNSLYEKSEKEKQQ